MKNYNPKASLPRRQPVLRFSATSWAKLLFLRDAGDSEIAAFGISFADDPLRVEDVRLVRQTATWITAELDNQSVAEFFNCQVDGGRHPSQFGRLFLHTHPGTSAQPSGADETTFARVFGRADWALMFILAREGQSYARLRYNLGPGVDVHLPVEVDYNRPFAASDWEGWQQEYEANVQIPLPEPAKPTGGTERSIVTARLDDLWGAWRQDDWDNDADLDCYAEGRYVQDIE